MLDLDSSVLVGTSSGLVNINSLTLQESYINKWNSDLTCQGISSLARDSSGKIWIGTACGLIQWDGNNWLLYNTQNSILPSNGISTIHYSRFTHAIYVGSGAGHVVKIDNSGWSLIQGSSGYYPQSFIKSIATDQNGNIWIGTILEGVCNFNGTDWQCYDYPSYPILGIPRSLDIDSNGNLWILTTSRLVKFDGSLWTFQWLTGTGSFLSIDSMNNIWISSSAGFYKFNGTILSYSPINNLLTNNDLSCHLLQKDSIFWIGKTSWGVDYISGTTATNFPLYPEMASDYIRGIAFDYHQNKVWLATYDLEHKVYGCSYNDSVWENIFNIFNAKVFSIAVDSNSNLFLGSYNNGLFINSNGSWTNLIDTNCNLNSNLITALCIDMNNNLLIGFENGSVQLLDQNGLSTLILDHNSLHSVQRICPTSSSEFWICSDQGGLTWCNYSLAQVYDNTNSGLPSNHITDLIKNCDNTYWITTGNGLVNYNGANWTVYNTMNSGLVTNSLTTLSLSHDSTLWIGTLDRGIITMKNSLWNSYNTCNSPLCEDAITDIKCRNDGRMYIGTNNGFNIITIDNIANNTPISPVTENSTFPNPSWDYVNITINAPGAYKGVISIYNINGQLIHSNTAFFDEKGRLIYTWNVQDRLDNGMYYYTVSFNFTTIFGKIIRIKN